MVARRRTTINHAFAAAIAPSDQFDDQRVRTFLQALGQDPDKPLSCAYCGDEAETWDHVFATVENGAFSGWGHRIGNLLPCCKRCNSRKGNHPWQQFIRSLPLTADERVARETRIAKCLGEHARREPADPNDPDVQQLSRIRDKIVDLLAEGDRIAAQVRERAKLSESDK
jgi:hypothetical protein